MAKKTAQTTDEQPEADKPAGEETQARMTFGEHLDELRKRILRALLGGLIGVGLCVIFMWDIYRAVVRPYILVAALHHANEALSTLKPQESFFTVLTLAVKAGLILASPWIIFQLWQFVSAGLYKKEKKVVYRYVGPSVVLFLMGVAFFYFIVLPMTLNFFFSFSAQSAPVSQPTANWLERFLLNAPPPPAAPAPATQSATATAATATATATAASAPEVSAQRLPVLTEDPPAPPEGTAIIYYDAVARCVKVRLHDGIQALPAGPPSGASGAQELPALADDPPAPPEGMALLYYHTGEQRMKVRLHDQVQVPMVVAQGTLIINTWRSDDYLNFVAFTALIFGLAFELPMVMLVLAQIDIVQAKSYRSMRKYAYFGIVVGAVIVAPSGDIMTLAFLFIPLVVLYELGILVAAFATRGRDDD
jgi:sec-independent protein translocase protein TatC